MRKDRDGRIVFANEKFAALFGKSADEMVGRTLADFYPKFEEFIHRSDDEVMKIFTKKKSD